ncbi:hypothetical protein CYMTET_26330 [Cymbomonas tetramitiformis]|uniref:Laminin G domain-containing protein n=1 Tax=Cymbomonas tetramitiformis TaxID=36881 RepID=A0AAE0KY17_9CHLO|nr:hypothetical protein CYMTET_26330 [Cymbomonas tetramitiformis]
MAIAITASLSGCAAQPSAISFDAEPVGVHEAHNSETSVAGSPWAANDDNATPWTATDTARGETQEGESAETSAGEGADRRVEEGQPGRVPGGAARGGRSTAAAGQKLSELALGTARWVESAVAQVLQGNILRSTGAEGAQAHARLAARVVSVAEVALDELGSAAAGALGLAEGNAPQAERRRLQQRGSDVTPAWGTAKGAATPTRSASASSATGGETFSTGGEAFSAGDNYGGQLGDGTATKRYTPVRVMAGHEVVQAASGIEHTVFVTGDLSAVDAADTSLVGSAAELGRLPASPPPAATTGAAADMPFYGVGDFYGLEEFYGLPVPPNIDAYALTPPSSSPPAHSLHPATSLATHAGGGLIAGHGAATGATARAAAPQGGAVGERRERQLREGLPARVPTPHLDPEETAALLAASPAPSAPTQRFTAAAPFDLAGRALVFAPRGVTTYQTCLEDNLPSGAPASPAASPGATHVDFDGDGVFSQSVQLSAPFHFFGRGYAEMRVEASGRLTFGAGAGKRAGAAATWPPLGVLDAHLAAPGISALLVAAAEVPAGVACWHEEVDSGTAEARLLVTWQLPGDGREGLGGFTAQAALHLGTGRIRLAWAGSWEARAAELVVGLSAGPELAHVPQSDLSASPWCAAPGSSDGADDERGGVGDADSGAAASAQAHTLAPRPSGSRRRADRGRAARRRTEERRAAAAAALAANSPFKELFSGLGGAKASPSPSPSLHGDAQHSDVHDLTRRLIVRAEQLADDVAAAAGESPGGPAEDPMSRAGSLYRGGRRSGAEGEGSAGAYYYPHGVQREVPEEVVTGGGWELCYDGLESLEAAAGAQYYFANCEGEHILLAARGSVDSKNALLLLAAGRRAEVLRETHSEAAAAEHNGAFWYNVRGRSVGFAPSSVVSLQLMDVRHRYTQCEGRLSWRALGLALASSGGRAGCSTWSAAAGEWRKVAYHRADRIHLPRVEAAVLPRRSVILSSRAGRMSSKSSAILSTTGREAFSTGGAWKEIQFPVLRNVTDPPTPSPPAAPTAPLPVDFYGFYGFYGLAPAPPIPALDGLGDLHETSMPAGNPSYNPTPTSTGPKQSLAPFRSGALDCSGDTLNQAAAMARVTRSSAGAHTAPSQVFEYTSEMFDLAHTSLIFWPSMQSGIPAYAVCLAPRPGCGSGLPDPPSAHATSASFPDDGRHVAELHSPFVFFGEAFDRVYIGGNGEIGFAADGSGARNATLAHHFRHPRIAALCTDRTTAKGGAVKYETLEAGTPSERLVVTWESVTEGYDTGVDRFQVALCPATGSIQLSWAEVASRWALVGLSRGGGTPSNFTPMDLSRAPSCAAPSGVTYVDHQLRAFTGAVGDTVRLPAAGVAANGNAPRSIVLRLRTAATEDYCAVSTGTAAENGSFSVMSYGSQGRCIGVLGYLNDFHPGYRGYPAHCTAVNDGAWHHVAVTYDGEGKLVVYVDGMEDNRAEGRTYDTAGHDSFLGRSNDEHYPDLLVGEVHGVAFYSRALSGEEVATAAAAGNSSAGVEVPLPLAAGHSGHAFDWLVPGDADKVSWREFYGLSGIRGDEGVPGNGGSRGWPRHSPASDLEDAERDTGSLMYDATGGFYGMSHEMAERYRTPSPPTGAPPHPHLMWDHAPPWWYEHGLPHPPVPAPVQVEVLPGDALAAVTLRPGESFLQEIEVVNRGDRAVQFGVQVEYWAVLLEGVEADGARGSAALAPLEVGRFRQVAAVWRGGWWGCGREASCGHPPSPDWPWQACKRNCDGVRRPFSFELLKNGEHVLEQPAWGTLPLQCATPANGTDDIICDVDLIIAEGDTLTVSWYGASHAAPSTLESPSHSRRGDADQGTLRLDLLAIPSPPPAFSNPPRGAGGGVRRLLTSTPTATTTPTAANTVAPTTSHHHTAHPTTHSPTATIPTAAPTAGLAPPTAAPTTAAPAADSTVASPLDFPTASPTPAPTTAAPAASPTTDFAIDGPTSAPSTAPKGSPSSPPTVPSTAGPTSATSPTMPPPEGPLTPDEAGIPSPVLLLDGSSQEVARGVAQAEGSALITLNHSSADRGAAPGSRRITLRIFPAGSSARDVVLGLPAAVRVHQHVVNASCGLAAPAASSAVLEAALRITAFHDNLSAVPPTTGGPRGIYWGGAAQGVRFQLEVSFSTSPGIEAEELASLLEVTNGDVLHSRENEACRGLQADVVGWVHLADPWRQNHTAVWVQMPDTQSSTEAVYGHRPVAELFAMDTVAMEHGHCTAKRDALLIVMFSEPVIGFDLDALEFGPGIHPLVSKAISGTTASYHVYVGFNESFVGHTFVRLRSEAVEDHQGATNLPTAKLELTRVNFLPFSQLPSYRLNASNPYILAP